MCPVNHSTPREQGAQSALFVRVLASSWHAAGRRSGCAIRRAPGRHIQQITPVGNGRYFGVGSVVDGGSFNIKQLLTASFVVIGLAAAAKAKQPFGDQ